MHTYYRWKFTVLLAAILLLVVVRVATVQIEDSQVLADLCGAMFLIAAILTICDSRRFRGMAFLLGIPAIVATVGARLGSLHTAVSVLIVARIFSIGFLGLTIGLILRALLTQTQVTWDSIVGTFCGYLLLGVMWSEAYSLLHLATPGALHFDTSSVVDLGNAALRWQHIQYFSFATLTTVGYGDITPVSPAARALSSLEAICGQFYLAVLVAGLVGIRVPQYLAGRAARHHESPVKENDAAGGDC